MVADASAGVGLGHLSRCTALAEALGERGFEVAARALGAEGGVELDGVRWTPWGKDDPAADGPGPDVLLADTYDEAARRGLVALPHRFGVAFEDALLDPAAAEVTIAAEERPGAAGLVLGGLRFACLRRPFWDLRPREIREPPRTVLVSSGGSDLGGLAGRVAARLHEHLPAIAIELVWAPGFGGKPPQGVAVVERPASLLEPLLRCDAVVCTGGQTLLEAAATGAPVLALEGAVNQRPQIAALATRGAALAVGEDGVPAALERLLADSAARQSLSARAREAVDGRGALRLAAELEALVRAS